MTEPMSLLSGYILDRERLPNRSYILYLPRCLGRLSKSLAVDSCLCNGVVGPTGSQPVAFRRRNELPQKQYPSRPATNRV